MKVLKPLTEQESRRNDFRFEFGSFFGLGSLYELGSFFGLGCSSGCGADSSIAPRLFSISEESSKIEESTESKDVREFPVNSALLSVEGSSRGDAVGRGSITVPFFDTNNRSNCRIDLRFQFL